MHVIRALPTIDATISYIPINGIKFYFPAFFSFPWDETPFCSSSFCENRIKFAKILLFDFPFEASISKLF